MPADTPAVVLGAGLNGLGVARSLTRVPTWLLDTDTCRPAMHTRAAIPLSIASLQGEPLIDELARLGTTVFAGQRPVLLMTQEESVKAVSQHRERLAPLYRFTLPPAEVVDALLHKDGFQRLAMHFDAPIPKLVHVTSTSDLPALEKLCYPVAVKPGERNAAYGHTFQKAYRVDSARQANELLQRILPVMSDVVVQEWIDGPDANIHFCLQYIDREGQLSASFTGRKIRSWPPQVGGTASCVPAPEVHRELSELTARFFRNAAVVGMAGMEYKRDARNGRFVMVEPTIGRTDYQAELATLNGTNLPLHAWCSETGTSCRTLSRTTPKHAWRVRGDDMRSAMAQHQRPRHGFDEVDVVSDALWRWNDPMPGLVQGIQRLRRALAARGMKFMPRSQVDGSKP